MELIAPGVVHWTAPHERIGVDVSSYYLSDELVLLDPMEPPEGLDWFEENGPPTDVLLTNRHHDRHAWRFAERFGCRVHCVRVGVHELEDRGEVVPFDFGDELPGGAIAHEVAAICPDECAFHFPKHRALAVADGVIRYGDQLNFVPDKYMDDAEETKRELRDAYARLAEELDFDTLLVAHGEPLVGGARALLREFAEAG
jgi:glyoxylase-like metal-dependent hydrolase (beta-lactamase superfamily II)